MFAAHSLTSKPYLFMDRVALAKQGDNALGSSVRPSVCPSVRLRSPA